MKDAEATDQFVSAHHGEAYVDERHVGLELLRRDQRGRAVVCDPHRVPEHLERLADHVHRVHVVVDEEDAFAVGLGPRAQLARRPFAARVDGTERQADHELAPLARAVAVGRHRAVVEADHLLHDAEPDPETAVHTLGRLLHE